MVLSLVLALMSISAAQLRFTFDAWWHLRSGDLILDRGAIPREDPFAWTAAGRPWRLNSWLYDVLAAELRRLGGRGALVTLTLVAVFAFGMAAYLLARRAGARQWPSVAVAGGLTFLLTPLVAERPQQLTYVLFAATLALAPLALRGSNPALVGLAAIFVFWANLHFAFSAGAVLVVLLATGTAIQERRPGRAAVVTATVLAAALVNPFGWRAYGAAFETRGTSRVIEEWKRLSPTSLRDLLFMAVIALAAAALWRTGRWRRLSSILPVIAFSMLAVDAVRNVPYLFLVAAAELALAGSALRLQRLRRWCRPPRGQLLVHGVALALGALVLLSLPSLAGARPAGSDVNPVRSTVAIPTGCRLLNQYEFGGYITDQRWPEVLVSQDGRNGSEQDFERQQDVIDNAPGALEWIDDHSVDCVLVAPDEPIVMELEGAGWRTAESEASAVLLVRP